MSSYNMSATGVGPLTMGQISQIDIAPYDSKPKLPNKKVSIDIHTAHGGYVVKVGKGYGVEDDMYVISEDQDLGKEIGKIITHHTLANE